MGRNCQWCSKYSDNPISVKVTDDPYDDLSYACGPACELGLKEYFKRARKDLKWALLLYVALVPLSLLFVLYIKVPYFGENFAVLVALAGAGLIPLKYPVFTQNTIESIGVLNAMSFVRFICSALVLMGVLHLFLVNVSTLMAILMPYIGLAAIVAYWVILNRRVKRR